MISSARFLGLATGCAMLLAAGVWIEPAGAQGEACKGDTVTAAGRAKFRPFSKQKELEGRGAAMADAVANWEREVGAKYGERWKLWSKAKATTFSCESTKKGKVIGGSFIGCTIRGRPCAGAAASSGGVAEREGRDKDRDRADRKARDTAPAKQAGGSQRTRTGDEDYEREMEYQDRLAEQRAREEAREYEREMERQRALAEERRRSPRR